MLSQVARVVGALLIAIMALGLVFLIGMRTKSPLVVDTQRKLNRAIINPRARKTAGTPGATASIVRHTGRRSGKTYETPVGPFPTDDGFVIMLPYGTRSDWLKNVLASGSATIVREGQAYLVDRPELLPIEAAAAFVPDGERRNLRLFNVDQCVRLHRVEA